MSSLPVRPLPPLVVEQLSAVQNDNGLFFFYDDTS
jgi:hypothetical protein